MRRAALVDEHLDGRVLPHQRAGGARMVEMDVRQEELADIAEADALRASAPPAGCRAMVDGPGSMSATPDGALKDGRRNDLGMPEKVEIDVVKPGGKCGHGSGGRL